MKKIVYCLLAVFIFSGTFLPPVFSGTAKRPSSGCDLSKSTICTIEIWLAHNQKKHNMELRGYLKSKSIKVLRNTIQYWRPKGGHPPTNVAIGSGVSAQDARMVIGLAKKYNDKVDMLIIQALNPPHYVAIATSAWDEKSQVPISPEELEALKDPGLTTEEFHKLYRKLTNEANLTQKFY